MNFLNFDIFSNNYVFVCQHVLDQVGAFQFITQFEVT